MKIKPKDEKINLEFGEKEFVEFANNMNALDNALSSKEIKISNYSAGKHHNFISNLEAIVEGRKHTIVMTDEEFEVFCKNIQTISKKMGDKSVKVDGFIRWWHWNVDKEIKKIKGA